MDLLKKLNTANQLRKKGGWFAVKGRIRFKWNKLWDKKDKANYQKWIKFQSLNIEDRQKIQSKIADFAHQPLISIILPVYNVEEKWLRLCLESVAKQLYKNWELCIADDNSPSPHIRKIIEEYAEQDKRIKVIYRETNGHISAASNSALELATGEFCVLLDHDDELSEDALFYVSKELNEFPETVFIYSDEDMIDEKGNRFEPKFKPDFSRDLLYSLNLFNHLSAYKTEFMRKINGFRLGLEGSQDYDLALRVIEQIDEKQIRHIPKILYHWRVTSGSLALSSEEKPYAHQSARKAIQAHFDRLGVKAQVSRGFAEFHKVKYYLPPNQSISVVSPENIVLNNKNVELIKVESISGSSLNSAFKQAKGDVFIFLDAAIKPISEEWIEELSGHALRDEVGAVGAKILSPNGNIKHCGIIFGIENSFGFAFNNLPEETLQGIYRAQVTGNFSAVSGVLAIRRELFEKFGGFETDNFEKGLFEIDLCLRLGKKGLRIVFTPLAKFVSQGISTAEKIAEIKNSKEIAAFQQKWKEIIENDKFYNPNLSLRKEDFSIKLVD